MNVSGFSSWPTATVTTGAQTIDNPTPGQTGGTSLPGAAKMWLTPDVPNGGRAMKADISPTGMTPDGKKKQVGLQNQVIREMGTWATPLAHDVNPRGPGQVPNAKAGNRCLGRESETWPTPAAQNVKGSSPDSVTRADGKSRMDILHYAAEQGFSHPAPETAQHGPTLSQLRPIWRPLRASVIASHGRGVWRRLWKYRNKRRLNPLFVEWLMAWPSGHALCACSETAFTLWQRDMRGALSALPMASGPWIWLPPKEATLIEQLSFL